MKKLRSRIGTLEHTRSLEKEKKQVLGSKSEKEALLENKLRAMKKRCLDVEAVLEQKESLVETVNCARDKYREQVLVLKQDVKALRKQLGLETLMTERSLHNSMQRIP